jgi:hypothetical protein
LGEDIPTPTTERYPPDDLKKWLTDEDLKKRDERWKNGNNRMKERKPEPISRLKTGYTKATHGLKMKGVGNPLCAFCNTDLSIDHILWECKETEDQRTSMDLNKEKWINGTKDMEKMIDYEKNWTVPGICNVMFFVTLCCNVIKI